MLGFAPFHFFPVPLLTLAGLLLLWNRSPSARSAAFSGFAFGLGLFLAGVSWVYVSLHDYGGMAMPVAALFTLLFCAFLAGYPAAVGWLVRRLGGPAPATMLLLFPALWALADWARGWVLSGFPWLATGYSQTTPSSLAGYAPVLGVFGISLAAALAAGAIALAAQGLLDKEPRRRRSAIMLGTGIFVATLLVGSLLAARNWTQPAGEPTSVALLQGNIPQEMKWRPERALATLETYQELARSTDAKLILLPETALPMFNVDIPREYLEALAGHARGRGGDLLVGVPEMDPSGRYYNSVMSLGSSPVRFYRKHHLVPFGDYFPLKPVLGWIMELLHIPMSDFSHGDRLQEPIPVAGQQVAVNICYEDAFGEEIIRQLPKATVLANFTNDAWWGNSIASVQHLQIAQMRALETGRPMLRATNTGITAIIDPKGRIVASAADFVTTVVKGEIRGYQGATPYVRWGNYAFLGLSAMMLMAAMLLQRFGYHHRGTEIRRKAKRQ